MWRVCEVLCRTAPEVRSSSPPGPRCRGDLEHDPHAVDHELLPGGGDVHRGRDQGGLAGRRGSSEAGADLAGPFSRRPRMYPARRVMAVPAKTFSDTASMNRGRMTCAARRTSSPVMMPLTPPKWSMGVGGSSPPLAVHPGVGVAAQRPPPSLGDERVDDDHPVSPSITLMTERSKPRW